MQSSLRRVLAQNRLLKQVFDTLWAPLHLVFWSLPFIRNWFAPYLRSFPRNLVYTPTGTGLGQDLEIRRLWREGRVTGKDLLIIGTEQGGEIARYWLPHRPRRIIDIDLYEWPDEWGRIERLAQEQGIHCAFYKMNGSALALLLSI